MFSNLHQASLPGAQLPGNQCTFMSLSAIIYFTLVKPFPQSEDDMLAILNRGNSYYESNMREICQSYPTFFSDNHLSFYTSPSHIRHRNVRIFGHEIVVRTRVEEFGRGLVERDEESIVLRSIGETLMAFLVRRPNIAAIAICQSYSRAIMKRTSADGTTTKYYLFDPHQFDSATAFRLPLQGPLPPNDNNAAFVAFDSAESLIWSCFLWLVFFDNYDQSENLNLQEKLEDRFRQLKQERQLKEKESSKRQKKDELVTVDSASTSPAHSNELFKRFACDGLVKLDAIPLFHPTSSVSDAVVASEIQDGAVQLAPGAGAGATPTPAINSGENIGNNKRKRAIKSNSKYNDYQKADKKQCATGQNKWTKLSCLYVLLLLLVRQYQSISRK
ncbi:hypothetical protein TYRP_015877 [Tyrophagus putrescentiae]|nr:hypothetical protein TYRP_015877 [Tyrophagus putrescentiae]